MNTGRKIKDLRRKAGLTQKELAQQLFVTEQAVSQWENSKTLPDADRLRALADALRTTADELLCESASDESELSLTDQMFSEERMYARIKTAAEARGLVQTYRGLPYAREKHARQYRKPAMGSDVRVPYIVHPLTMACHALAMGIADDEILAVCLLHDVCEDCGVSAGDLPFSDGVKNSVKLLTKDADQHKSADKKSSLSNYFDKIGKDRTAAVVKCLDRCNNLTTTAGAFTNPKMREYIAETEEYILPLTEVINQNYPDLSSAAFLLKYQILSLLETQKAFLLKYPHSA